MTDILRYSLPLECKASGSAGILEGYASTFGPPADAFGDVIRQGAFKKSLNEHQAAQSRPALLWAHDMKEPIGKFLEIAEDDHGLHVRGKLTLTVPRAADAFELARDGALAFSIGFGIVRKSQEGPSRVLEEVKLAEVSLVAAPANPKARITHVKSLLDVDSIRDYELFLRDFGLSHREAKRLSIGGWNSYRPDDVSAVADLIQKSAQHFRGTS